MELEYEELIKRLVKSSELKCSQCLQFYECNSDDCEKVIAEKVLAFINQQQAEIERLKSLCTSKDVIIKGQEAKIERYEKESNAKFDKWKLLDDRTKQRYAELYEEAKEIVRTEAIKEFAERLKSTYRIKERYCDNTKFVIRTFRNSIDSLLAEMVGEQNV